MERIHADERLRADLIARGTARARAWNWERTAEATVEVYRRLVASGGGAGAEIAVAGPGGLV
jgi:glycosyltransferase involved in cell wall biosynthesis